jgi:hypothetical protein
VPFFKLSPAPALAGEHSNPVREGVRILLANIFDSADPVYAKAISCTFSMSTATRTNDTLNRNLASSERLQDNKLLAIGARIKRSVDA